MIFATSPHTIYLIFSHFLADVSCLGWVGIRPTIIQIAAIWLQDHVAARNFKNVYITIYRSEKCSFTFPPAALVDVIEHFERKANCLRLVLYLYATIACVCMRTPCAWF